MPKSLYEKRLEICEECEHFQKTFKMCKVCKCLITLKARMPIGSYFGNLCPKGKWEAANA